MAVATRPYFLIFNDQHHMVEATSPAAAVRHVVGAAVTELRPARGSEVNAWHKAGKPIPVAGEKAAAPAAAEQRDETDAAREGWDGTDARTWLLEQKPTSARAQTSALAAWDAARAEDRLTLEHFDVIRTAVPVFAEAIGDHGAATPAENVDAVRASLEENPMSFADVVHAIGEAKRAEMYAPVGAE